MDELEISRAANLVIKHHREDAWFHASTRADDLLDEGELEGAAVWRKILAAIGLYSGTSLRGQPETS